MQKTRTSRRVSSSLLPLGRHFIIFAGRLSATPLHDPVESLEICPRSPILKEARRLQSRNLLRHGGSYELIQARSVLLAQPLDRLLERPRQPQGVCPFLCHCLILPSASRGSRTSTPNCEGAVPKSRTLNVTRPSARPLTAASS